MATTNEQDFLDSIVGHTWYVRRNHVSNRLEFIPQTLGDYKLSQEELDSIGEVGYSLPLHPHLLCQHENLIVDGYGMFCPECNDYPHLEDANGKS
jgi:hypothetical protein